MRHQLRLHRPRIDLVRRHAANRHDRLLHRTRLQAPVLQTIVPEPNLNRQNCSSVRIVRMFKSVVMFNEALRVVNRRAGQAKRLAVDFSLVVEERRTIRGNHLHSSVFEAPPRQRRHLAVVRLHADQARLIGNDLMPERLRKVLSVPDRPRLRIAHPARRQKNILCLQIEILGVNKKTPSVQLPASLRLCVRIKPRFSPPLNSLHRTVRQHRHFAVPQQIAKGMDDRRRLAVRRKHPSVRHAPQGHVQGLEPGNDLPRRTRPNRLGNETLRFSDIREELLSRNILGEVATSVRRHQHLRTKSRLALDEHARNPALGRHGRGEHAGRPAADNRKLDRCSLKRHVRPR